MINPRAIAVQGVGYGPLAIAYFGIAGATPVLDYADANARAYGKKKRPLDYNAVEPGEKVDWALRMQIAEEDEIVLALVMAAAPLLGAQAWQLQ